MASISPFICVDKMPSVVIKKATTVHTCQKVRQYLDEHFDLNMLL